MRSEGYGSWFVCLCVCVCVCVCWVLGEEEEDSPSLWEAFANLTTCGCLVVQSVCIINC